MEQKKRKVICYSNLSERQKKRRRQELLASLTIEIIQKKQELDAISISSNDKMVEEFNSEITFDSFTSSDDLLIEDTSSEITAPLINDSSISTERSFENRNIDDLTNTNVSCVQKKETPNEDPVDNVDYIKNKLKEILIKHSATHSLTTDVLKLLKSSVSVLKSLPSSPVTLFNTPKNIKMATMDSGTYYYFGIAQQLLKVSKSVSLPQNLKLIIGVDGVPLFKAAKTSLWPIMGEFLNVPDFQYYVFPIAIYCGKEKPHDPNIYLQDFVNESVLLHREGLTVVEKHINIQISAFCTDAPAKSFILGIKGHTGFHSCTRCKVDGMSLNNRVFFNNQEAEPKTHEEFLTRADEDHHRLESILTNLEELDIVRQIPLDYMHLVCLGVVKKELKLIWIDGKCPKKTFKLRAADIEKVSARLIDIMNGKYKPSEINRCVRELRDIAFWKATEFRSFLLYVGVVVLKGIVHEKAYQHFLMLHMAMTILLSKVLCKEENIDFAKDMLKQYVKDFSHYYGIELSSHNVHGLLHLADDARIYGPLDHCSAFKFENYLGQLKQLIKKPNQPLKQVVNRLYERNCLPFIPKATLKTNNISFSKRHKSNILPTDCEGPEYKVISIDNFILSLNRFGNRCFLTSSNSIVLMENIVRCSVSKKMVVLGREFIEKQSFYSYNRKNISCDSGDLGIWEVKNLSEVKKWQISDINLKMFILPLSTDLQSANKFVVFPLLHLGS